MPEPTKGKRFTLEEVNQLEARQRAAELISQRERGAGISTTLSGPRPEGPQGAFPALSPIPQAITRGAEAAGGALAEATIAGLPEQAEEIRQNPFRLPALVGGALIGGAVGGQVGSRVGGQVVRFASGNLLRSGSPLFQAGMRVFSRATGAGAGSAGGGELTAPLGETTPEAISRRLWDGALGAAGELAAPVGKQAVRFAGGIKRHVGQAIFGRTARSAQRIVEGGPEVQRALSARGATATFGQLSTGWPARTVENIVEASFGGGPRVAATKQAARETALQMWRDALPLFGRDLSEQEVGTLVDAAITNTRDAQVAATRGAYNAARNVAASMGVNDDVVPMDSVVTWLASPDPLAVSIRNRAATDPMAQAIVNTIGLLSRGPVSFAQAEVVRGELLAIARSAEKDAIQGTAALARPVAKRVDEAIEVAVNSLNVPEVRSAYLTAREMSKLGQQTFNDEVLGELIGKHRPEQIAQSLHQNGVPSRIDAVHDLIFNHPGRIQELQRRAGLPESAVPVQNPDELWAAIQNNWSSNAFLRASPGGVGGFAEPSGKQILRTATHSRGTFEAIHRSPEQRRNIITAARAMEITQSKAGGAKAGTVFFQLKQAGAAAQLGAVAYMGINGDTGTALGILAFPMVAALPITSRRVVNFMMERALAAESRRGELTGRVLTQYLAQLVNAAVQDGLTFSFTDPQGNTTTHDPRANPPTQGPLAPTAAGLKPVSKQ